MDITIIGTGNMARGIATRALAGGNRVTLLRPIDAGPLALAHQLEALGYLNMAIQPTLGTNYGSAVKVLA